MQITDQKIAVMIECPHCLRIFQEGSAERHIKFCEEIHSRIPVYNENWDAKSKLAMRTQVYIHERVHSGLQSNCIQ